eukprot:3563695-Lingulodinium_polyedra.AAC.1
MESKLFYNACVWSGFDPKDLNPLDAVRILAWRRAKGWSNVKGEEHVPDAALWHEMRELTAPQ